MWQWCSQLSASMGVITTPLPLMLRVDGPESFWYRDGNNVRAAGFNGQGPARYGIIAPAGALAEINVGVGTFSRATAIDVAARLQEISWRSAVSLKMKKSMVFDKVPPAAIWKLPLLKYNPSPLPPLIATGPAMTNVPPDDAPVQCEVVLRRHRQRRRDGHGAGSEGAGIDAAGAESETAAGIRGNRVARGAGAEGDPLDAVRRMVNGGRGGRRIEQRRRWRSTSSTSGRRSPVAVVFPAPVEPPCPLYWFGRRRPGPRRPRSNRPPIEQSRTEPSFAQRHRGPSKSRHETESPRGDTAPTDTNFPRTSEFSQ